jgi:hypothetical protein
MLRYQLFRIPGDERSPDTSNSECYISSSESFRFNILTVNLVRSLAKRQTWDKGVTGNSDLASGREPLHISVRISVKENFTLADVYFGPPLFAMRTSEISICLPCSGSGGVDQTRTLKETGTPRSLKMQSATAQGVVWSAWFEAFWT